MALLSNAIVNDILAFYATYIFVIAAGLLYDTQEHLQQFYAQCK